MLTRDQVIENLHRLGKMSEPGVPKQAMDSWLKNQSNPLDKIPAQVKLTSAKPDAKRGIVDIFEAFYNQPDDNEVYQLEIENNSMPIDGKIYAAMKALLQMGITPNVDIASACRKIFTYLAKIASSYPSTENILKEMPSEMFEEKELKKALKKVWGV